MQPPAEFTARHRRRLEQALGRERRAERPLSYPQVAGFLYAVVAAPHTIVPSRWWPLVLGDEPEAAADDTEGFAEALMALNNLAAHQVLAEPPAFPPGCGPPARAAEAMGPAPFGQWVEGFLGGHRWLDEQWQRVLDDDQASHMHLALTTLAVFADRATAATMLGGEDGSVAADDPAVDELAEQTLPFVDEALDGYMRIARAVRLALHAAGEYDDEDTGAAAEAASGPYRRQGPRVGRNDPCPCGSGRKYKHCCGARVH